MLRNTFILAAVTAMAASVAQAAPVLIGLQEAGTNLGAITQEATGNGTASLTNFTYGSFSVTATASGTPPNPEPNLLSTSFDFTANAPGTLKVYVSELNQFPPNKDYLKSIFSNTIEPVGAGTVTVTEATYENLCAAGPGNPCVASDAFQTTTLLSTTTFTANGTVTDYAAQPFSLTLAPFATTEVYTITATGTGSEYVHTGISLVDAPEPISMALLGTGLIGLGMARRKRV